MSPAELEAIVRVLADKEAIRDLARLYAHHVWQRDATAVAELFSDDGEMDTSLEPPIRGRAALRETFQRLVGNADFQPFVHNHVIDLEGDRASGTCYVDLRATQEGRSMIGSGYYQDRYARTADGWRFQSRALTLRFFVPLDEGWAERSGREAG
jgi:ketosteroid isomerase-like protein